MLGIALDHDSAQPSHVANPSSQTTLQPVTEPLTGLPGPSKVDCNALLSCIFGVTILVIRTIPQQPIPGGYGEGKLDAAQISIRDV